MKSLNELFDIIPDNKAFDFYVGVFYGIFANHNRVEAFSKSALLLTTDYKKGFLDKSLYDDLSDLLWTLYQG